MFRGTSGWVVRLDPEFTRMEIVNVRVFGQVSFSFFSSGFNIQYHGPRGINTTTL